ncbi:MAG TPA: peptidylprolyl isomerase [Streptosporangiaceae bacterium]|nr:peptidylprolyl isomerase [Streptosporangiaceae bacterium]
MTRKRDRARKIARERYERQLEKRVDHRRKLLKRTAITGSACVVAAAAAGGYFLFGTSGSKPAAAPSASASATPTSSAAAAVSEPAHHCTYIASGTAKRKVSLPPSTPDYSATYQATIATNRGNIVIDLLNSKATCTVNSFVHLADQKYFSSTKCHRLTTSGIYVLQCGDPTGTGTGGPGYEFGNENLAGAKYTAGTVAMANTGQPDSNGSQFFLVYKNSPLPASYTPFGKITQGLDIVQNVAKAGSDNSNGSGDGHPKENVIIKSVTIKQT